MYDCLGLVLSETFDDDDYLLKIVDELLISQTWGATCIMQISVCQPILISNHCLPTAGLGKRQQTLIVLFQLLFAQKINSSTPVANKIGHLIIENL